MVPETALHHDPIHGTGQVDVCSKEHDVFPLQRGDALVHLHQVRHDLLERENIIIYTIRPKLSVKFLACSREPCHLQLAPGQGHE